MHGIHFVNASGINTSLQTTIITHTRTHTHTHERERERIQERETGQAAEDKTVGWYFLLGLVYRTCRTREKNWKTQQQKTERTVKKLLRPFSVMWRGTKEHSRPDSYSKKLEILKRGWRNIIGPYEIHFITPQI